MSDEEVLQVLFEANLDPVTGASGSFEAVLGEMAASADSASVSMISSITGVDASLATLSESAVAASSTINSIAPYDLGQSITDEDVAQAKLTLLETKVQEAHEQLVSLQNAANAGEAVVGIDEAQANLTLLAAKAQDARSSLQSLQVEEEDVAATANTSFSPSFGGIVSGFGGLISQTGMTIFGLQAMGNMAVQTASSLFQPAIQAENTQASFSNLLGSTQAATDELSQLNDFAAKTQFKTQDIDNAAASMIAFKVPTQDIIPELTGVGDALTAVGKGTPAEMQSVVDILGKMSIQGKLTQGDITQLGTHGINALNLIAEGSGKTTKEIQDMISKGTLPARDAIDALTAGIEHNPVYSGGMAKQSSTLSGQLSTLSSDWDQVEASMLKPVLPELEQDFGKLTTVISSPSFKEFAKTMGSDVATGLKDVLSGAKYLIDTGTNLVGFFQHNQTAMDALKAVLVGVGAVIYAAVVPAFIAWGVAMIPVAIEAVIVAAPFIALGLIVGAVVFGIIEAVQHWGQISKWLTGEWSSVQNFFGGVLHGIQGFFGGIGNWFHDRFVEAKNGTQSGFSGVQNFFQGIGKNVQDDWKKSMQGVVDGSEWMYKHNTYYKAFADDTYKATKDTTKTLQDDWGTATSWLTGNWKQASDSGSKTFSEISDTVKKGMKYDIDQVEGGWKNISGIFGGAWNNYIARPTSEIFSSLSSSVTHGLDTAKQDFIDFWTGMNDTVSGWENDAIQWGENILISLGQGIENQLGNLEQNLSNVGGAIASYLGFHSPAKKGEGAHLMEWPKNLIASYGAGLESAIPSLESSLNMIMQPVSGAFSSSSSSPALIPSQGSGSNSTTHVHIHLDSQEMSSFLVDPLMEQVVKIIRLQGGRMMAL